MVNVDFIMVEAYSPYMTIMARPWLHAEGVIFSTLHVKLKYPTEEGVRDPNLIKAIHYFHLPQNPKVVQGLTGMTATLNRFLSRLTDQCRPFFLLSHKRNDFFFFFLV